MSKNDGVVEAFQFNKDSFEEMEKIYVSILRNLGVKNAHEKLKATYTAIPEEERNGVMFNKLVSSLFKDDNDRKTKASKAFNTIKDDPKISPYVKAYIAEAAGDYCPYDTVLTAARMVGGEKGKNGKSLQMGCGEGKTGVLSMAAYAILQSEKRQVFLTSSTENLAAEALDKIDFYDRVGLAGDLVLVDSSGITRPRMEDGKVVRDDEGKAIFDRIDFANKTEIDRKRLLKEAYSSKLVISDNVTLMQDAMKGYLEEPTDKKRELLADEADFVLLDSYRPLQRTQEMTEKEMAPIVEQRTFAYEILKQVKAQMPEGLFVKDDSSQYVDFTKEGRQLVVDAIRNSKKAVKVDMSTLYDYVYDALVVDTVYKENRDYQILNKGKKIVSEDRASGVGIDLPEGVKQALEIKLKQEGRYKGPISPEEKVLDTLNTQTFFKKYFNGTKHFISGTLGIDSKAIAEELKNFGVSKEEGDIYEIPPKEKRTREDRERKYYTKPNRKRREIIKSALKEIEAGRPVLIGTVSEEEINELKQRLQEKTQETGKNIRILEFTAASEDIFAQDKKTLKRDEFLQKYGVEKKAYKDYKSLIKHESGKPDTITLGTSILGRGTTIKTPKTVDAAGGIHVIIDGLHETSSRNQEQYKARTARGDNNGSTQEFFSYDDIPEEVRRDEYIGLSADEIYEEVYEKIDARTSGIRNYVVQFVEKTVEKLEEIDQMTFMPEEYRNQAKALLAQRAFSIKNRACGVSDKFQTNIQEYEREIEAYAKLYVAKYRVTDEKYLTGGRFDETKWLAENGYEDIAETHMPFKKSRENEIFRNSGIKTNKVQKEAIVKAKAEADAKAKAEEEKKANAAKKSKQPKKMKKAKQTKQVEEAVKPISDHAMTEYYKNNFVEMEVAPIESLKDNEETIVEESTRTLDTIDSVHNHEQTVAAESVTQPELKLEDMGVDFGRNSGETDWKAVRAASNIITQKSLIRLSGLKDVSTSKNSYVNSTWSKIIDVTKAFKKMITHSLIRGNDFVVQEGTATPEVPDDSRE